MIVKTDAYTREQIGKVVQMRANVEGIKLLPDVVDKLAGEGEKSSLRYVFSFFLYWSIVSLFTLKTKLRPSTADPCFYSCWVVGAETDWGRRRQRNEWAVPRREIICRDDWEWEFWHWRQLIRSLKYKQGVKSDYFMRWIDSYSSNSRMYLSTRLRKIVYVR